MTAGTGIRLQELLTRTGLTYRVVDYWARVGVVDAPGRGMGYARHWEPHDVAVLRTLARLRCRGRPGYGVPLGALQRVERLLRGHVGDAGWVVLSGLDGPAAFIPDAGGLDADRLSELLAVEPVAIIVRFDPEESTP